MCGDDVRLTDCRRSVGRSAEKINKKKEDSFVQNFVTSTNGSTVTPQKKKGNLGISSVRNPIAVWVEGK